MFFLSTNCINYENEISSISLNELEVGLPVPEELLCDAEPLLQVDHRVPDIPKQILDPPCNRIKINSAIL